MDKSAEGILAEYQAGKYLEEKGYTIIARNLNYPQVGELDIVAIDGKYLVVVEVKYRSTKEFGYPIEAVTKSKIKKIIKATERFLLSYKGNYSGVRFDVISIQDGVIEHIPSAFYGYWN